MGSFAMLENQDHHEPAGTVAPYPNDPVTITRIARRGAAAAALALGAIGACLMMRYDFDSKGPIYQAGQCAAVSAVIMLSRAIGMAGQSAQAEQIQDLRRVITAMERRLASVEQCLDDVVEMQVQAARALGAVVHGDDLGRRRGERV